MTRDEGQLRYLDPTLLVSCCRTSGFYPPLKIVGPVLDIMLGDEHLSRSPWAYENIIECQPKYLPQPPFEPVSALGSVPFSCFGNIIWRICTYCSIPTLDDECDDGVLGVVS